MELMQHFADARNGKHTGHESTHRLAESKVVMEAVGIVETAEEADAVLGRLARMQVTRLSVLQRLSPLAAIDTEEEAVAA